jgi:hypothetical protein
MRLPPPRGRNDDAAVGNTDPITTDPRYTDPDVLNRSWCGGGSCAPRKAIQISRAVSDVSVESSAGIHTDHRASTAMRNQTNGRRRDAS